MGEVVVAEESIAGPGARSVYYAALDGLARLYGPGADEGETSPDELGEPSGFFLVARDDGELVGGVGVRTIVPGPAPVGEVKRLWVRPDRRRGGVARALMEGAENVARSRGFSTLFLETGPLQDAAIAFYKRIGWDHVAAYPEGVFSYELGVKFARPL